MKLQKIRWSKVYESTEEELVDFLNARNITYEHWSAEEFTTSELRSFSKDTMLWCAEGSLTLQVDATTMSVQPGDAFRIPAGVQFQTIAGMSGCICYESVATTAKF